VTVLCDRKCIAMHFTQPVFIRSCLFLRVGVIRGVCLAGTGDAVFHCTSV